MVWRSAQKTRSIQPSLGRAAEKTTGAAVRSRRKDHAADGVRVVAKGREDTTDNFFNSEGQHSELKPPAVALSIDDVLSEAFPAPMSGC